jgi:hypothetical protein
VSSEKLLVTSVPSDVVVKKVLPVFTRTSRRANPSEAPRFHGPAVVPESETLIST